MLKRSTVDFIRVLLPEIKALMNDDMMIMMMAGRKKLKHMIMDNVKAAIH